MALISKQEKNESENVKILISHQVKEEIMAYCQWATIEDLSYFFN
jgi:glutaredoxin-related protein